MTSIHWSLFASLVALSTCTVFSCSDSDPSKLGGGNKSTSGGKALNGGAVASGGIVTSGGMTGTGGIVMSGGMPLKGGTVTSGGVTTKGGTISVDGSMALGGSIPGDASLPSDGQMVPDTQAADSSTATGTARRYRIVTSSDFPPFPVTNSDPDDVQSMVRFLLYTNDLDVEGMVASSGTYSNIARKANILAAIDKYAEVVDNLKKHDPRYPSPDSLRAITFQGRDGTWGKGGDVVGDGKDSEASDAIIAIVDKPDPRPVWFSVWGGTCEVAQAIYKVKKTRSAEELDQFISKMRIYQIANQDGSSGWMNNNFPKLFIINSTTKTYWGMTCSGGDTSLCNLGWLDTNIRKNHGPLGAIYPERGCCVSGVQEGDSPSFMHLVSAARGMNDPEDPTQPSWGGQYTRQGTTNHFNDGPGGSTISKYRADFQKDFALRADWMLP